MNKNLEENDYMYANPIAYASADGDSTHNEENPAQVNKKTGYNKKKPQRKIESPEEPEEPEEDTGDDDDFDPQQSNQQNNQFLSPERVNQIKNALGSFKKNNEDDKNKDKDKDGNKDKDKDKDGNKDGNEDGNEDKDGNKDGKQNNNNNKNKDNNQDGKQNNKDSNKDNNSKNKQNNKDSKSNNASKKSSGKGDNNGGNKSKDSGFGQKLGKGGKQDEEVDKGGKYDFKKSLLKKFNFKLQKNTKEEEKAEAEANRCDPCNEFKGENGLDMGCVDWGKCGFAKPCCKKFPYPCGCFGYMCLGVTFVGGLISSLILF